MWKEILCGALGAVVLGGTAVVANEAHNQNKIDDLKAQNEQILVEKSETTDLLNKLISGQITEITAEDLSDVEEIKPYAFYGCTNLVKVELPANIKKIGTAAFGNCANLETISFNCDGSLLAESNAFSGCENIKKVTGEYNAETYSYKDGKLTVHEVADVNTCPWSGLNRLVTEVELDSSVTIIPASGFSGASIKEFTIPDQITEIGRIAFTNSAIESLTIPDKDITYGFNVFNYCNKLTTVKYLGTADRFEIKGTGASLNLFDNSKNITNVEMNIVNSNFTFINGKLTIINCSKDSAYCLWDELCPLIQEVEFSTEGSITKLGWFYDAYNLKEISLPSVSTIYSNLFTNCISLEKLTIPASVTSISNTAFSNSGIKELRFLRTTPPTMTGVPYKMTALEKIYVPAGTKSAYISTSSYGSLAVENGGTVVFEELPALDL